MGKESIQAEERYLTKCANGISPGMILLKAKLCMHHPLIMACSRFLTSADKSGFTIKEEGHQLGGKTREKGQSQVHLPTKCYIQIGIGHQTQAVKARGSLAPVEHWVLPHLPGTGVHCLCIQPENQVAQTKTNTGQNKIMPWIINTWPLWGSHTLSSRCYQHLAKCHAHSPLGLPHHPLHALEAWQTETGVEGGTTALHQR